MPNHVHVLFTLKEGESLPDTLQGWKGVSSRLIHKTGCRELAPCLHGQVLIELRKVGFEHIGIEDHTQRSFGRWRAEKTRFEGFADELGARGRADSGDAGGGGAVDLAVDQGSFQNAACLFTFLQAP